MVHLGPASRATSGEETTAVAAKSAVNARKNIVQLMIDILELLDLYE